MSDPIKPEPGPLPEPTVRCPWCNSRIMTNQGESWCEDRDCLLACPIRDFEMDQLIRALARDKRILAGHSIEIMPIRGQFPDVHEFKDRVEFRGTGIMIKAPTAQHASKLWNNLAKDRP